MCALFLSMRAPYLCAPSRTRPPICVCPPVCALLPLRAPLPVHAHLFAPSYPYAPTHLRPPLVRGFSLDTYVPYIVVHASHLNWTGFYLCPFSPMDIHLTLAYAMLTYGINRG
jgi:hypothetical protein